MNNEDLLRMAKEAGFDLEQLKRCDAYGYTLKTTLAKFAALVQSATAEECARIVCSERDGYIFTAENAGIIAAVRKKLAETILDKYQDQATSSGDWSNG